MNRTTSLKKLTETELDVLVIGGGITGAGIALDAQSRGLQTAVIEMQDFAAGTSSRSTKLVHGGLRYLKQLEISIVAEVGKERAIVYENAPHVTTPEWMLLPIVKGGTFGKLATSFGIRLYDYLAGVKKTERRKMLNREETLNKEPLLRKDGLKGSGYYVEYRTDDARLTIEVLKKAVEYGALAYNYLKVVDFIYENRKIKGVLAEDVLTGEQIKVLAKQIVNATGPWVDDLREKDGSKQGKTLHWTKGVHLVMDQSRFPLHQSIYFDTPDKRMVFAIPRDGKTYIGTTDTDYHADLVHPRTTHEDQQYLIAAANHMFPSLQLTEDDIESSWAGVRPLIHEEGKAPSEISRHDEIFHSKSGLITIAGGKLTGYRKMAERVVDMVAKNLGVNKPSETKHIILSGGDVGGSKNLSSFLKEKKQQGIAIGLEADEAERLAKLYGSNVDEIYAIITEQHQEAAKNNLPPAVYASLVYGLEKEMVLNPVDFFARRTGAMFFHIDWVKKWKEPVLEYMRNYFAWNEAQTARFRELLEKEIKYATSAA
ncbi:glycerol-3-phosphate dehydrogenase/oxidase [Shimazuella sp. AN120528]|uniref:glycerol-3-phosphate dehydrogenase/oxidase n=1 Tax=Shimazuella soli TaxID=1892854 RepID=UPI001F100413|nr:FAD-dependent oxidoreductase [Shimazuella soli]MCH5583805.1 glycerol-3-phosphate dehydrogenase/oxidase [Shimazuella soli]